MTSYCKKASYSDRSVMINGQSVLYAGIKQALCLMIFALLMAVPVSADEVDCTSFAAYLKNFDDYERTVMKIRIPELLELYKQNKVQIIDVRTPEEFDSSHLPFARHIPINELPQRLGEIDRNKIVVTVCRTYVRAAIARTYLVLNGFESRYLVDGMSGLSEYLQTESGKEFYQKKSSEG